jgi:hypothetical protein
VGVSAVDALAWVNALPADVQARVVKGAGISLEREKATLDAWHAKQG